MHHSLVIIDIILIIFSFVRTKRDLAALAATCKTFRDPALEILWSTLRDFAPLARCLPNDIWNEAKDSLPSEGPGPVLTTLV
jgi:hypothetical protein